MYLSIIVPVFNEAKNIEKLYFELNCSLNIFKGTYEIILVDDCSTDSSLNIIKKLSEQDKNLKYISFNKNFGQTQAIAAGIDAAKGGLIVTLDADLQNPPEEIPKLVEKLEREHYDCVSGWRKHRKDDLKKKLFSRLSFLIRKLLFKDKIHDAGCTLKVYKKECFDDFEFYGESHRFITTILQIKGFKVGECVVKHKKRFAGKTKYGAKRLTKGFLDLIFIKFWNDFSTRPLHFFGNLALFQYSLVIILFVEQILNALIISKFITGHFLLLGVLLFLTATLTLFLGFLSEMLIRSTTKSKRYKIKKLHRNI